MRGPEPGLAGTHGAVDKSGHGAGGSARYRGPRHSRHHHAGPGDCVQRVAAGPCLRPAQSAPSDQRGSVDDPGRSGVCADLVGPLVQPPRQSHLSPHQHAIFAVAADPRCRREGHLRPHPEPDVPGFLHHRARHRGAVPHRLRDADADPRRAAAALRRGGARGALSHPQVRPQLSPIRCRRATLRLGVPGIRQRRSKP